MFTITQAAELASIQPLTLRMWFQRGHFSLAKGDLDAPQGGIRYLSLHTTLAICIAAELTRLHVPLDLAAYAGHAFAHTRLGSPRRNAGGVLYGGSALTFLAVRPNDVRIFPISAKSNPLDIAVVIEDGATTLAVDQIVKRIEQAAEEMSADAAKAM